MRLEDAKTMGHRLAVTGANGFVGRHFTQAASALGWEVVGVVRSEGAARTVREAGGRAVVLGGRDPLAFARSLEGCGTVVHLAQIGSERSDATYDAVNVAGTTCSTTTFVTTPAATPPASPSGLTTSTSNISVILNWTDNANNETGYVVQRCQGAACTPADLVTVAANLTSFTDNTASQKAVYVYQVLASNPSGRSGASNQSTVITPGHQPTATSHMISH